MSAGEDYGGWTPAAGESPAEREKRMKREKRAAMLAAGAGTPSAGSANPGAAPYGSTSTAPARANESYGGWQPAAGESPAEREKRMKREKRAAMLAAQNGSHDAPPHLQSNGAPPAPMPTQRAEGESYDGWRPLAGESPAEREKRIKREKRAAMLAGNAAASGPPAHPSSLVPPPAELGGVSGSVPPGSEPAGSEAGGDKKSKHAQSLTAARMRYLKRKKQTRKAKVKATPKNKSSASTPGDAAVAGTKRQREEDEEDESGDEDAGDESADDGANSAKRAKVAMDAAATRWPELSEAERQAKLDLIAKKKAERREQRLAKKAELKRIKAEGGVVPPPKPRVVETTKSRKSDTKVVEPPVQPESAPEPEQPAEPTEEELEEQKRQEELAARKALKALKKQQRRQPKSEGPDADGDADMVDATKEAGAEADAPTLIPTAHDSATVTEPGAEEDAEEEPAEAAKSAATTAVLHRLPSATRPAPPSAKTLSALKVHEQVRDKQVVDPTLKVKIAEEVGADGTGVSEKGRRRLRGDMGVEEWFAGASNWLVSMNGLGTDRTLIPQYKPLGKTISYVVPIVETLQHRIVTRLRALVLLPTRDLVGQVRETFEAFIKGTGLKVGIATGQHSFAHEQSVLVGDVLEGIEGGVSQVDILIATPGRLMDHLKSTAGFSLQHLRYLVVDEADRLLTQSFHDWLPTVLSALKSSFNAASLRDDDDATGAHRFRPQQQLSQLEEVPTADALAPSWWDAEGRIGRARTSDLDERCLVSCQKLLFSATLSRDPAKIDALHLYRPVYISVEDALDPHAEDDSLDSESKFTFPAELSEHMIISPSTHKPLYLFHLLHTLAISSALCFTRSVEAATRLAKLVEFFEEARAASGIEGKQVVVRAFSSDLAPSERHKVLRDFKKGEIHMLICSDLIARGIDIPNVSHVISYDIPVDMRKYVHRVGRTARAGKQGDAWSLVEEPEVAPFRSIMSKAQHYAKIERVRVKDQAVEPFVPAYQTALERLRAFFATGREREA
ncbi:ATP-dependent RNA helicase dbp6 [Rhodotorula sphaerocarpa]